MYFQTYLDSSTAYDDGNLEIAGYNLICIYNKNSLPHKSFEYSLFTGMY